MAAGDKTITRDSLFSGRLQCLQHSKGYRFSVDSLLLAHFIAPKPGDRILDLCAGCGVVSLILAYRWPRISVTALEFQPQLTELLRRNVELNNYAERISVIKGDCREISTLVKVGSFDRVVCNPPYRKVDTGRQNPISEQAVARHEVTVDLENIVKAISFAVKSRGRATLVYPARRAAALIITLKKYGLEPKRLQMVHSYPGAEGELVLLEAVKGGGEELAVLPPFYLHQSRAGDYTAEMAKLYGP